MMKKPHVFNVLTREGWLAEIDPLLARSIIDAGRLLVLRRGDSLFHPNDEPGGMYGVVEGGIIISALGRDGLPVAGHIHRQCGWFLSRKATPVTDPGCERGFEGAAHASWGTRPPERGLPYGARRLRETVRSN